MLTTEMKSLINRLWDNFWSGGIAFFNRAIEANRLIRKGKGSGTYYVKGVER